MKVSIQGIKGSFHHMVANEYFESFELLECSTFENLVKSIDKEESDFGVMAIENSIAGSILPNYALIDEYNLYITGEHYLNINHNLMCLAGQKIDEIYEVQSHPMALLQCSKFFNNYPNIKLIESEDTALFAKKIKDEGILGVAAIASKDASEIYNLEILNESIQTIKNNKTRFVILEKKKTNGVKFEIKETMYPYLSTTSRRCTGIRQVIDKIVKNNGPNIIIPYKYLNKQNELVFNINNIEYILSQNKKLREDAGPGELFSLILCHLRNKYFIRKDTDVS